MIKEEDAWILVPYFEEKSKEIYDLIKSSDVIIIHRHINPDGDALGCQWGLKKIIEDNFNNKKVLVPGDINDYMLKFFNQPDIVNEKDYKDALVIVCDTANKERISGQFWQQAKNIIKIDHHPNVDNYATLELVNSSACAATQVVTTWAKKMNLKVSKDAAKYLFLGLVTDSGRFLYRSVNSETFDVASFLMQSNFDFLSLYETLYKQNLKMAWIKGHVLNNFKISKNGLGYLILKKEDLQILENTFNKNQKEYNNKEKITLNKEEFTGQVNLMSNIEGIKIWMIACQDSESPDFKVSVRSSRWKVNDVVAKFGGGGHDNAAAAKLENIKVLKQLFSDLDKLASLEENIK